MCHPYLTTGTLNSAQTHRFSRWVCSTKSVSLQSWCTISRQMQLCVYLFVCLFVVCCVCACHLVLVSFPCSFPYLHCLHFTSGGMVPFALICFLTSHQGGNHGLCENHVHQAFFPAPLKGTKNINQDDFGWLTLFETWIFEWFCLLCAHSYIRSLSLLCTRLVVHMLCLHVSVPCSAWEVLQL